MKKLIRKIGKDKVLHFAAGFAIGLISLIVFKTAIGVIVPVMLAGILKEMYDWVSSVFFGKNHTPEWQDMVATWAGGAIVLLLLLL